MTTERSEPTNTERSEPANTERSEPDHTDRSEAGARSGLAAAEPEALGLLDVLPEPVRALVSAATEEVVFEFGEVLVREGDPADAVWVLRAGRARVLRRGADGEEVVVNSLGPGATFGEIAVLQGIPRTATVRASTPGRAGRLPAALLRAIVATEPAAGERLEEAVRHYQLTDLLRLASPLARLSGDALGEVVDRLRPVELAAGGVLMALGDTADALYLVEDGRLVVTVPGPRDVGYLRRGDVVGERGLVTGDPRDATVTAVDDCRLLRLGDEDLQAVAAAHPELRQALADMAAAYDHEAAARVPLDFAGVDGLPPDTPVTPPPDEAPTAAPLGGRRTLSFGIRAGRRVRLVRQIDEADCGVAALRMVCLYHGKRVPHPELRDLVGTETDGTSAAGLVRAARHLGFDARAVKVSKAGLAELVTPAILHLDGIHWVVLTDVKGGSVGLADPGVGHRRLPLAEFLDRWSGYAVLAEPGPLFEPGGRRLAGYGWLTSLVRPHLPRIALIVGLAAALSALELSLEVITQIVVDRVVGPHHHPSLAPYFAVLAAVLVVLTAGTLVQRLVLLRVAQSLDRASLDLLSGRLLALPLGYFASRRPGDLQRRMDGLRMARARSIDAAAVGVALLTQLLASLALLAYYSLPIAALFAVTMPGFALVARVTLSRLQPAAASLEEEAGRYASRQVELVKGIETVKALAAEEHVQAALVDHQTRLVVRQVAADRLRAGYSASTQGLGFALLGAFLAIGSYQVLHHELSVGALVACETLVALATAPVQALVSLADSLQQAGVLFARAQDVFAAELEQDTAKEAPADVPTLAGHITLDRVGYAYGDTTVLEDISVDIPAGATVAVVGRSGSGKTTLVRCVAGLLAPTSGTIRFDGVDAAELDRRQLRRQVGFVLQESYLFSDTVEANVALGSPLDPAAVEEASRVAHAHEFVSKLPLGYQTRIGESGMALSGGQRQRLAIARALYRRPPILILDEATSALDTESERAVQDGLATAQAGRTSIVIAHRLSTVRHADVILVLDEGRLVERGTHDELVARRGLYFLLASQQLGL